MRRLLPVLLLCFAGWAPCCATGAEPDAAGVEFFESKIRPLLVEHCLKCHGADEQESELRLDTLAGMLQGGAAGAAVVPGKPGESLLLAAVKQQGDLQMPPDGKLAPGEIAALEQWIARGAAHPDGDVGRPQPRSEIDLETGRRHWAFQPLRPGQLPRVDNADWPRTSVDFYVLAQLQQRGLEPSSEADRMTLLRRVTFDLTGLPPTADEVAAFAADQAPGAYQRLVDRLLASPRYGERWGRHWLDVARYADSNGLDENLAFGNAWRYRDYVVAAWNSDTPYDQFLLEQLAGDLMEADDEGDRRRQLIATGFLSLGPKVLAEVDETKMEMDIIDEQLDTLGRSLLGLTIGCARCHDHKFDPISTRDYYSLAGVFKSTRTMDHFTKIARWHENQLPLTDREQRRRQQLDESIASAEQDLERWKKLAEAGTAAAGQSQEKPQDKIKSLNEEIKKLKTQRENLASAMGAEEGEAADLAVHIRGSHLTLGEVVPRGIPEVFGGQTWDDDASGRLRLAGWLVSSQQHLTARVIANRLWRWHMGRGLVATVDNFGRLGERPSHPQLLDHLAAELIGSGWSLKQLHRQIVLSSTYRMSSSHREAAAADPENRLLWRFPVRRLEAEAVRDSLLFVSGLLDSTMGGSMLHVDNREFLFNHTSEDGTTYQARRRSLYLPVVRNHLYDVFQLFDYSDASVLNGSRSHSVTAPQSLYLLNGPLVADAAEGLERMSASQGDEAARLGWLYLRLYGRQPQESERERALEFVEQYAALTEPREDARRRGWQALCHALLISNEFLYVR